MFFVNDIEEKCYNSKIMPFTRYKNNKKERYQTMRTRIKQLFRNTAEYASKDVEVCAWVRTNRSQAQFGFLNINDGSFFENLQVVYE